MGKALTVRGRRHLTLCGNGARMITHFDPAGAPRDNNDLFHFEDCSDLTLRGFVCDTDRPICATGTLLASDEATGTLDIRLDDEFPVTGREHYAGTNSFDADGSFDYFMATYHQPLRERGEPAPDGREEPHWLGIDYTVIGEQTVRLLLGEKFPDAARAARRTRRLAPGHRINLRYIIYGNAVFSFQSCHRVLLQDIEIPSAPSFGVLVRPRSSDFTFDRFHMRLPQGTARRMAANADGIHIQGMTGKLILRHCDLEQLGDDPLNLHNMAGGIGQLDRAGKRLTLVSPHPRIPQLPRYWACPGDRILAYDTATFLQKGSFVVDTVDGEGNVTFREDEGDFGCGDTLANEAYYAAVQVEHCVLRNTRARGLLLQTRRVLISDCYLYGMSLAAILCAPDNRYWWEVGPSREVEIRNCLIEKCAHAGGGACVGALIFKSSHDAGPETAPAGVHSDLYLHGNTFLDLRGSGIYLASVCRIRIEDNRFLHCGYDPSVTGDRPYSAYDIVLRNCEDAVLSGNRSDRGRDTLVYAEGCAALSGEDAPAEVTGRKA